jgi:ribose 5-phosphate isomerase B
MDNATLNTENYIAIGADHAAFDYKTAVVHWLNEKGYKLSDFGLYEDKSVDYPDHAHPVANAVVNGECGFGILFCGSGNGVAITANKHQHIRAALCWQNDIAELARKHNNANVICIPARFVSLDIAKQMIETFIATAFEGGRHQNRVNKIDVKEDQ